MKSSNNLFSTVYVQNKNEPNLAPSFMPCKCAQEPVVKLLAVLIVTLLYLHYGNKCSVYV